MQQRLKDTNENWISNYYRKWHSQQQQQRQQQSGWRPAYAAARRRGRRAASRRRLRVARAPPLPVLRQRQRAAADVVFGKHAQTTVDFCHAQVSVVGRPQECDRKRETVLWRETFEKADKFTSSIVDNGKRRAFIYTGMHSFSISILNYCE